MTTPQGTPANGPTMAAPMAASTTAHSSQSTTAPSASTSADSTTVSDRAGFMRDRIAYQPAPSKRPTVQSACYRCHELHGEAAKTWENRVSGEASSYHHVAKLNEALRALGLTDKIAELMAPIDASLAGACHDPEHAELRAARADAVEDVREADFRLNPCAATLRPLLQARAIDRQASLDHDRAEAARFGILL